MENFKIGLLLKLVNDGDYDTEDSKSLLNKYEINEKNYMRQEFGKRLAII